MKRKIEQVLSEWKNTPEHNPLVLKGCRQCGKTYSVMKFAEQNYKHVVYINFFENPNYADIFGGAMNIDTICGYITAAMGPNAVLEPNNSCIILDEIQECPNARTALKFFKTDGRYDVICTGSLLGIQGYKDNVVSVPVGYETIVDMYPMDFEEFLWAAGVSPETIQQVAQCKENIEPVPNVLHEVMKAKLREYVVVGGMPAVVKEYIRTAQFGKVLEMQRGIVNGYRDDMIKYAAKEDKGKIRECFDSIPKQLAKENKKFQYSLVKKKGTASTYAGSIQWIEDAGIIRRCYNTTITELPLDGNAIDDTFKIYMADIGLFVSMLEDGTQFDILQGRMGAYKGAIYENLVADILGKAGRKLYYFRKDSGLEIDFLMRYKGECVLLECKAKSGDTKSARTILKHPEKYHVNQEIKLGDYNVGKVDAITTLPLYMAFLLREF